jgi:hypothetical protein
MPKLVRAHIFTHWRQFFPKLPKITSLLSNCWMVIFNVFDKKSRIPIQCSKLLEMLMEQLSSVTMITLCNTLF